jgi:hypothetical protein
VVIRKRNIAYIVFGAALVLLIPLIAMQFTDDVNWSLADFVTAFVLLSLVGLVYELLVRRIPNKIIRYVVAVVVLIAFLLVWAELAVGIFN